MTAHATDPRLPFELISKVMDHASVSELVSLSHICSAWRRAARAHPGFWRDIKVHFMKPTQLELFLARLRAHTSGIDLELCCLSLGPPKEEYHQQFRAEVLPAVRQHLFRVARLKLTFSDHFYPHICDTLAQPAPMLQDLLVENYPIVRTHLTLALNVLSGCAPRLTKVTLGRVGLPRPPHVIAAFRNVESLRFTLDEEVALPDILAHFPALKHADISIFACRAASAQLLFPHHTLTTLDIEVRNGTYTPFFSAFRPSDLAAIAHLSCSAFDAHGWIQELIGALEPGPLTLTIRDFVNDDVSVELAAQGRSRTLHIDQSLIQGEEDSAWWWLHDELFTPDLLARVSRFRLISQNVAFVPEIADELPACDTLELWFDGYGCHGHRLLARRNCNQLREPYALKFPAVRTVICSPAAETARGGASVSAAELSALLAKVILARPSPLDVIELAGVQLTGDIEALEREYGCAVRQQITMR